MSTPTYNDDTKQDDAGVVPPIRMIDLNSLTLPLFMSDDGLGVNSSSCQMEKFTPSAPILTSESKTANLVASNLSAASVVTAQILKHKNRINKLLEN
jgi:hypothetical protein